MIAIPKFYVSVYIKIESTFPRLFWGDLPMGVDPLNSRDPLYRAQKRFCSVYGLHGTQNDLLKPAILIMVKPVN